MHISLNLFHKTPYENITPHDRRFESREAYHAFLRTNVLGAVEPPVDADAITITRLVRLYHQFAKGHYTDTGPRSHFRNLVATILRFESLYHSEKALAFGPKKLREFRAVLIEQGQSRSYINDQVSSIRKMFRWAVSEELIPETTYRALMTIEGIKRGREGVKDSPKKVPAKWEEVDCIAKQLPEPLRSMVYLQWHTGVRSESLVLAHCDQFSQEMDGTWWWKPRHKTEYLGRELSIPLGPKATAIVIARMEAMEDGSPGYLFPSSRSDHYRPWTYRRAVERCQERHNARESASIKWTPHQLRHAKATYIRGKYGVEAAQALLGHDSLTATQIYSQARLDLAKQIASDEG